MKEQGSNIHLGEYGLLQVPEKKNREYTKLATKSETIIYELIVNKGVRAGGARGAAAPSKFWATQIFWAARVKLGKVSFQDVSIFI